MQSFYFRRLKILVVCTLFSALGYQLKAQGPDTTDVVQLEHLTVVGVSKPSSTRQSVPIQALDSKEFERLGMQNLHEAVRTFAGASLKDYGGIGGIKTVSVRSMGSQHTAICYDGITISNTQSGQVDIGMFALDNVEQVSLSIGQSDDIFQTARMFASSGVLNIKTQQPLFDGKSVNVTAHMKVASFGTFNPYLMYQQKLSDRWSFSINGDWLTSNGEYPFTISNGNEDIDMIRLNSQVNTLRGEINLYGNLGSAGNLSFKGNYLYSARGLPGSVVLYTQDANEWLWDRNGFGSLHYENRFSQNFAIMANLKYSYSWNHYLKLDDRYSSGKEETYYTQNEYYGSVAGEYSFSEKLKLTVAEDFFINTLDATLIDFVYPVRYSSLTSVAGQYKDPRLTITASILGTYITEDVRVGEPAKDRYRISPSLSVSYKLFADENIRIRASYKDGFRAPTFNDLYYSRVGNKELEPEKASQFNLGVTWSGMRTTLSVDGYFNKVRDKIVAIPTMFIWRMLNVGEVNMAGLDLNGSVNIPLPAMMSLLLNANYSYQYAIDVSNPQSKSYRHQIPYTPRHSGNLTLSWKNKWVNLSYICAAVGKRYSFPQNIDANLIKGYLDHTVSLNRTFDIKGHKVTIMGEVLNIGDVNYEVVQYYPMPGRSYRFSIKYNF